MTQKMGDGSEGSPFKPAAMAYAECQAGDRGPQPGHRRGHGSLVSSIVRSAVRVVNA
jgi:hypothetical protein